ncbi:MAG: DUF6356 family protein [Pseudomonadota bacterium]
MMQFWRRTFLDHPQSVDETYLEHLRFAGWFAGRLFAAGAAAAVHALIPSLFPDTASRMIKEMHQRLTRRL